MVTLFLLTERGMASNSSNRICLQDNPRFGRNVGFCLSELQSNIEFHLTMTISFQSLNIHYSLQSIVVFEPQFVIVYVPSGELKVHLPIHAAKRHHSRPVSVSTLEYSTIVPAP